MKERYWLQVVGLPWQEATKDQFVQAEHSAGFFPKDGVGTATSGFSNGAINGRVTYGEITGKSWGFDPEFLEAVRKADKK